MARPSVLLTVACAAIVVSACGPRSHSEALPPIRSVASMATASAPSAAPATAVLATTAGDSGRADGSPADSTIDAELTVTAGDGVRFALAVANATKHRVELTFPDGRTREFAVYDAAGRPVWRWSAGRMFTQGMQARLIGGGDSVVYEAHWASPAPGRYTVIAQLRSDNHPIVRQLAFRVPETGVSTQVAVH